MASAAAAAAARLEGETPPCSAQGGEPSLPPGPCPQLKGLKGPQTSVSSPYQTVVSTGSASRREGEKKIKRRQAKKPPASSVVPIWLLAACLPLVTVTAIPVCSDPAHQARSLEESHTLLAGRRGRAAAAALPCWLRDANVLDLPAGRHHPESQAQARLSPNSSTCRPVTQWTATCSSHRLLTSLSSLIPHAAPAPGNIHEAIPFYWVAIGATTARRLCLPEPAPRLLKRATPACQGCAGMDGAASLLLLCRAARTAAPWRCTTAELKSLAARLCCQA